MNLNPLTQINLFEHKEIFNQLYKLSKNDTLPNKILLSGEKGIGKSTLAYHLINLVLSENEEHPYDFENLNKSSFNNNKRFVLIDNIELLNLNSINALLKILEEPNENINFILINNNKRVLPTLKSRCLNFKVFLTKDQSIRIVNQLLNDDINTIINNKLFDYYATPGKLFKLIKLSEEYDLDLVNFDLNTILKTIIKDKIYKKDKSIIEIIYSFIELYFRNNISSKNINLLKSYHYFLEKINNTKTYNLDEETLFMEFEDKILNG